MPTARANRGTGRLNRCMSPLGCMLGDAMPFLLIFQRGLYHGMELIVGGWQIYKKNIKNPTSGQPVGNVRFHKASHAL